MAPPSFTRNLTSRPRDTNFCFLIAGQIPLPSEAWFKVDCDRWSNADRLLYASYGGHWTTPHQNVWQPPCCFAPSAAARQSAHNVFSRLSLPTDCGCTIILNILPKARALFSPRVPTNRHAISAAWKRRRTRTSSSAKLLSAHATRQKQKCSDQVPE
jgi:hypothetical protein